ncbi:MAG: hypothetical protein ACTTI3_08005 [Treponema sp.]
MTGGAFWERTNALIKARNTTQEAIAKTCTINFGTFKNRSSKKTVPDAIEVFKIAQALNTTVEYLVTGKERNQANSIPAAVIALAEDIYRLPVEYQDIIRQNVEAYKALCFKLEEENSQNIG